ncbi:MAG: MAPEG family protein [Ramlibacter sp.]
MSQDLYWLALTLGLTALLSLPYVLNRIAVIGLMGAMANPAPGAKPMAAWAARAQAAHANAVENLVMFAPAALAVVASGKANGMTATACAVYFFARLVHYVVYTAGIPVARTLSWATGWAATLALVARVLGLV